MVVTQVSSKYGRVTEGRMGQGFLGMPLYVPEMQELIAFAVALSRRRLWKRNKVNWRMA